MSEILVPRPDGICIIWKCESTATNHGKVYCEPHYKQLYRLGWLVPYSQNRRNKICSECSTETYHLRLGKCRRCYQNEYNNKNPERLEAKRIRDREYRRRRKEQERIAA
jgi:hypothetical protein